MRLVSEHGWEPLSGARWRQRLPRRGPYDREQMLLEFARGKRVVHVGFVDEHRLETKVGRGTWLHARLAESASSLVGLDVEEEGVRWAVEHGLHIAAEALFDAGNHILSGEFQETADEYREIPPRLVARGVLSSATAKRLESLAGVIADQARRALDEDIAAQGAMLERAAKDVARIFLIEGEYALAMRRAEAEWVRGLLAELVDGTLPGVAEWRHYHETGGVPPQWTEMLAEGGLSTD